MPKSFPLGLKAYSDWFLVSVHSLLLLSCLCPQYSPLACAPVFLQTPSYRDEVADPWSCLGSSGWLVLWRCHLSPPSLQSHV